MSNSYRPSGFGGFSFFPPVLKNLLIINGVVFLFQMISGNLVINGLPVENFIYQWLALNPVVGNSFNFQIWQLITYQFLHGSFTHILFNMFALWMFGVEIENLWGSKTFLIFYLSCGVIAGIFHLLLSPLLGLGAAYTIGASGAIYGVLIAFAMLFPDRLIYLYFFIPVKAKYLIGFMIIIEFLAVDSAGSNVAHLAHLGGALAGFLYVLYTKRSSSFNNVFGRSSGKFKSFGSSRSLFRRKDEKVQDAKFYEIKDDKDKEEEISQEVIDDILDKISKSGYQNLTEKEKKILFEVSKKMN